MTLTAERTAYSCTLPNFRVARRPEVVFRPSAGLAADRGIRVIMQARGLKWKTTTFNSATAATTFSELVFPPIRLCMRFCAEIQALADRQTNTWAALDPLIVRIDRFVKGQGGKSHKGGRW